MDNRRTVSRATTPQQLHALNNKRSNSQKPCRELVNISSEIGFFVIDSCTSLFEKRRLPTRFTEDEAEPPQQVISLDDITISYANSPSFFSPTLHFCSTIPQEISPSASTNTTRMAIIEGVRGIEVGIRVKNEPAHEYEDRDDQAEDDAKNESGSTKQTTRYIESITDEEFQLSFSVNPRIRGSAAPLLFYVYMDGVECFTKSYEGGKWKYIVQGKRVGEWSTGKGGYQAFKFSRIETS